MLIPAAGFFLALLVGMHGAFSVADASYYRMLAAGKNSAVPNPFAVRVLGPAIAGWLGSVTSLGANRGFLILGIISSVALLVCLALLLRRWQVGAGLFAAIFLMPFATALFHDYFLPDLLHAALLAAMLLCLARGQYLLAMAFLFPEYLARESTLLVAACLAIAAWRRVPFRTLAAGALATIAGFLASQHFSRLGAPSVEGLRGGAYLAAKVIWNLPRNVLGLTLWTNLKPVCAPLWTAAAPPGFHLGGIQFIGLCEPSLHAPIRLLLTWAGIFGIGPSIALLYWRMIGREPMGGKGSTRKNGLLIVLRFCAIYGLISLLIAPFLGAAIDRLVEYAWPLFLVAVPAAIAAHPEPLRGRFGRLLVAHLFISWSAWGSFMLQNPGPYILPAIALASFAINVGVYFLLRHDVYPNATEVARVC